MKELRHTLLNYCGTIEEAEDRMSIHKGKTENMTKKSRGNRLEV